MAENPMTTAPLTYCRVGTINLVIENETYNNDVDVPKYAVERGTDITDHVQQKNKVLTVSGYILTDRKLMYEDKISKLEVIKNSGKLVPYYGRINGINFLIHKFTTQADKRAQNGLRFTMVLEQLRFAEKAKKPMLQTAKSKLHASKKQIASKSTTTTAKYHIVKKGDTYIGLGKKYATDWKQIKKWAGYPDTRIPIGVKVRVK